MKLSEAQEKFIQAWGTLGSNWGINRTMAQVHALLMISPDTLSADDIMEKLLISRGNANMNVRALIDWGLVTRVYKAGERKEFFSAEKDIWKVATQVIRERRKRELEPVLNLLTELKKVEGSKSDQEVQAFKSTIDDLHQVVSKADKTLEMVIKADENWLIGSLMKLMK